MINDSWWVTGSLSNTFLKKKKKREDCLQIKITFHIGLTAQEQEKKIGTGSARHWGGKKGSVPLPSDNNSPQWTDYPRETEVVDTLQ